MTLKILAQSIRPLLADRQTEHTKSEEDAGNQAGHGCRSSGQAQEDKTPQATQHGISGLSSGRQPALLLLPYLIRPKPVEKSGPNAARRDAACQGDPLPLQDGVGEPDVSPDSKVKFSSWFQCSLGELIISTVPDVVAEQRLGVSVTPRTSDFRPASLCASCDPAGTRRERRPMDVDD